MIASASGTSMAVFAGRSFWERDEDGDHGHPGDRAPCFAGKASLDRLLGAWPLVGPPSRTRLGDAVDASFASIANEAERRARNKRPPSPHVG
jgi:hypothetical protein